MDPLALVEGGEGGLLELGVAFELVRGGDDSGFAQEALELRFAEVGDADGWRAASPSLSRCRCSPCRLVLSCRFSWA